MDKETFEQPLATNLEKKIKVIPLKCARALTDLETGIIYINQSSIKDDDLYNLIKHELAHIISNDCDHGPFWEEACEFLSLEDKKIDKDLKDYRKRYGIPKTIAGNIGNISGIQNILLDYHLLQHYRKFSQRILGTEGQWEYRREFDKLRLFPVPRGTFPVVVEYLPSVSQFHKPSTKQVTHKAFLADLKMTLGTIRKKFSGFPGPDGSQINLDGKELYEEGKKEWDEAVQDAILLGEPLPIELW